MPKLLSLAALLAASAALAAATPAVAAPVTVNVRVEGTSQTFFEGQVTTDVHQVDGGGGLHECDGLNGGNPNHYAAPVPTVTGAFDDASKVAPFAWSGAFDPNFDDFLIHSVNSDSDTDNSGTYWLLWRDSVSLNNGGCQEQVQNGDSVVVARSGFDPNNNYAPNALLDLRGAPARAAVNEAFTVHVLQHDASGAATDAAGATVAGKTTGSDGTASVSFDSSGVKTFKADRSGAVRSNAATVCVYTPGSGECGTETAPGQTTTTDTSPVALPAPAVKDTTPPVIKITSLTPGKTYGSGPRELAGEVDESGGIAQVFLRLRATDGGDLTAASRCRWFSAKRGVFTHRTVLCSKARFFRLGTNPRFSYLLPSRLGKGRYVLDVKVLDRAYNAGRMTVPFGVR
jgi:hypothetical protein